VGYAGTLLFFITSLSIGLSIAVTALTSRALGRGDREHARALAGASLVLMALTMTLAALLVLPWLRSLLALLGASGETAALALRFMHIVLRSTTRRPHPFGVEWSRGQGDRGLQAGDRPDPHPREPQADP
jgi:Na+-driven multidrug efflux pump